MKVADLGSGIGGPLRCIARFSKAHVTGVNFNDFQIARTLKLNAEAGLQHLTACVKGDFMNIPFPTGHFDAAYQIEAFCHSPDRKKVYAEAFRILKPGGRFAGYQVPSFWHEIFYFSLNIKNHSPGIVFIIFQFDSKRENFPRRFP